MTHPTDDELRAFALWCRSNDLRHVLDPDTLRRTAAAYNIAAEPEISAIVPLPKGVPTEEARHAARGAALDAVDRMLVETSIDRLAGEAAWEAMRELDPDAPDPFLMNLDVVRISWKVSAR